MTAERQEVDVSNGLDCVWIRALAEGGPAVEPDMVPLGLIAAGLVVAMLAVVWLLPRSGGRKAGAALNARKGTPRTAGTEERLGAEVDARADRLERLLVEARAVIARLEGLGAEGIVEPKPGGVMPTKSMDELTVRVYELADSGQTPVEIAQTTGQHTGQVELILALRR